MPGEGQRPPGVPPLTWFLCSRCPSLPEILLIKVSFAVCGEMACAAWNLFFAKTGSPAVSPRDCWDPFFKFPKRFPSSVLCSWSQVGSVPPSVTVVLAASNHAIPGNCSQIIRRRVLQWRNFFRLALIWQASHQCQCILEYISIVVYLFLGNFQICWEPSI